MFWNLLRKRLFLVSFLVFCFALGHAFFMGGGSGAFVGFMVAGLLPLCMKQWTVEKRVKMFGYVTLFLLIVGVPVTSMMANPNSADGSIEIFIGIWFYYAMSFGSIPGFFANTVFPMYPSYGDYPWIPLAKYFGIEQIHETMWVEGPFEYIYWVVMIVLTGLLFFGNKTIAKKQYGMIWLILLLIMLVTLRGCATIHLSIS